MSGNNDIFTRLHGDIDANGKPFFMTHEQKTALGTRYVFEPGIVCLSRPKVDISVLKPYLFDFGYEEYINDPDELDPAAQLIKTAGQTCYHSFGQKRTWNKDADIYLHHIIESGHGSVLEHANFTFFFWGVARSTVMELLRHRHFSFSQLSQRYVGLKGLRFVERNLFHQQEPLHQAFELMIDNAHYQYTEFLRLLEKQHPSPLEAPPTTLDKKRLHEAARDVLPNCAEAPIVVTGNVRAWRGFIDQRATVMAEPTIRELAVKVWLCLVLMEPLLFGDYTYEEVDGIYTVSTAYKKV